MPPKSIIDILICPNCNIKFNMDSGTLLCDKCDMNVPVVDAIPRFYNINKENIIQFDAVRSVNPIYWTDWRKYNYEYFEKKLKNVDKSALIFDVGAGTQPFDALFEYFNTYKIISQDELKDKKKCIKKALELTQNGDNIIVDNIHVVFFLYFIFHRI